ncbi:hypothetical protein [Anaeromicropila herbilytica]|uniref:Uncharacterized protein n=1 Tax=Anaeromicropila herbilytica TaxID=2785025 RepID=A0A7R7EP85_9FIRM|nr:hypothetical protein [Anaeromicropila herbilytica]BCN32180.1 hypothetical protein bsdtb5_34750 [Anaeromicropila herbilytica]
MVDQEEQEYSRLPVIRKVKYRKKNGKHTFIVHYSEHFGMDYDCKLTLLRENKKVPNISQVVNKEKHIAQLTIEDSNYSYTNSNHSIILTCITYYGVFQSIPVKVLMETLEEVKIVMDDEQLTIFWKETIGRLRVKAIAFRITDIITNKTYVGISHLFGKVTIDKRSIGLSYKNPWKIKLLPLMEDNSYGPAYEDISILHGSIALQGSYYDRDGRLILRLLQNYYGELLVVVEENDEKEEYIVTSSGQEVKLQLKRPLHPARKNRLYVCKISKNYIGQKSNSLRLVAGIPRINKIEMTEDHRLIVSSKVQDDNQEAYFVEYQVIYQDKLWKQIVDIRENGEFDLGEIDSNHENITITASQIHDESSGPLYISTFNPEAPRITKLEHINGRLEISFTDVEADLYRIYIKKGDGQKLIYSIDDTKISISLYELGEDVQGVAVQAVYGIVSAGISDYVTPLLSEVEISFVQMESTVKKINNTSTARISWKEVPGCQYKYQFRNNDWILTEETEALIDIEPGEVDYFSIRLVSLDGRLEGPIIKIPIEELVIEQADFDGRFASIRWNDLNSNRVGFINSLNDSSVETTENIRKEKVTYLLKITRVLHDECIVVDSVAEIEGKELRFCQKDNYYQGTLSDDDYMVSVQSIYEGVNENRIHGRIIEKYQGVESTARPLLSSAYFFASEREKPYLYYKDQNSWEENKVAIYSNNSRISIPIEILGEINSVENDSFTLNKDVMNGKYILSIIQMIPTDEQRAKIREDYKDFIKRLEENEIKPYDLTVIMNLIGRFISQSTEDSLYYGLGYREEEGAIDLRPGMILRVEYASNQYCTSESGYYKSGYMANAVAEYEIASNRERDIEDQGYYLGLDAFFTTISNNAMLIQEPTKNQSMQAGGASGIDLANDMMHRAFYRLVLPTDLFLPNDDGESRLPYYMTIIAADQYSKLEEATLLLRSSGTITDTEVGAGYFMGRTIITPCIRIRVNGSDRIVPVGTTLEHVLNSEGFILPKKTERITKNIQVKRSISCDYINQHQITDNYVPICILRGIGGLYEDYETRLSLPLYSGDVIRIW